MKKYFNYLIRGIFAGIMIGVGGTIYLSLDNKIIGSYPYYDENNNITYTGMQDRVC